MSRTLRQILAAPRYLRTGQPRCGCGDLAECVACHHRHAYAAPRPLRDLPAPVVPDGAARIDGTLATWAKLRARGVL